MLRTWLSPLSVEDFLRDHFSRAPFARPGTANQALALLNWTVLEHICADFDHGRDAPDVLVAADGRLVDAPLPRCTRDVRRLMAKKLGVVIRKAERHHPQLAELARTFAQDLPGEIHVQLYATPAGTQAFGWHYDDEDVFIAQTVGTKDYYLRENTVARLRSALAQPDFSAVRREASTLMIAQLIPGDWLYIPSRWWHLVRSTEDALSISIGVIPKPDARVDGLRSGGSAA